MTLKNAFGDLALEATLKALVDGYGVDSGLRKVLNGDFYIVGTPITLAGVLDSTSKPSLQLVNPPTSTKLIVMLGLTIYSTVNQQVRYFEDATMAGTPTALVPQNANRASTKKSVATASWSSTVPTGGTKWPNESRVIGELQLKLPPVILPPNKTFTIVGQSSEAHTFTANGYFIEVPIPA